MNICIAETSFWLKCKKLNCLVPVSSDKQDQIVKQINFQQKHHIKDKIKTTFHSAQKNDLIKKIKTISFQSEM